GNGSSRSASGCYRQRAQAEELPVESQGLTTGPVPVATAAAMKAVVQRVTRASVTVGGEQISAIGRGICVLLGISMEDSQKELEHMVRKILNLRVFEDESGKHWSKSVMDKQYEVLCVSQFTLQCVLKGNKPDFHLAMPTEQAESFYNSFLEQLRKSYRPELVRDGKFGAYMQVHIQNDGPVTIELESPAPGAANSDPKQVSLKSGDSHGLVGEMGCGLALGSAVVLILKQRKHLMTAASYLILLSQECMLQSLLHLWQTCAEKVFLEGSGFSFWAVLGLVVMAPNCHLVAAEQQPWPAYSVRVVTWIGFCPRCV
ncbi:D-aminoacyl-tRNA deacylase 1, partial [Lemmus lemmus]